MKIGSMHLEHYRCFNNLNITLDDRLTVLVGINGAGKTAVLDALSLFLKWAGNIDKSSFRMPAADIAIGKSPEDFVYRVESHTTGNAAIPMIQTDFVYTGVDQKAQKPIQPKILHAVKQMMDATKPIFVSYMAGRSISENDFKLTQDNYKRSASLANENNFNRTIDYNATLSWFNTADADEARDMRDNGNKNELPELKAVRDALSGALLGQYERPRMIGNPPELIIYAKDSQNYYKVSQLSDGYRAMLALVMDLARRMAQSHGAGYGTGQPLLSVPAIVLIDEIELHLHPSWQQSVLTTLMNIFPNTQFIVTTHSPQVLSSIASKHIRILKEGKAYAADQETEGAEASRLLGEIFQVELRPDIKIV